MIAKLKLQVLPLVQTTRGFTNPRYSERLGEQYPISGKFVDMRSCHWCNAIGELTDFFTKTNLNWSVPTKLKGMMV